MSSDAPFAMDRLVYEDLDQLVPLMYKCFINADVRQLLLGIKTEEDFPLLLKGLQEEWREDPRDIWMKVTDRKTNKIVAATQWRLKLNDAPLSLDSSHPDWLEGEVKQNSMDFIKAINAERNKAMGDGPYLYLYACFTDADYRRQGAGAMMMKWGVDLADSLRIPAWMEASEAGAHLYRAFGFYLYAETPIRGMTFRMMKRDARTEPLIGGKNAPLN